MLGDSDQTDPHTAKAFGQALAELRQDAGYKTQKAFSEAVGKSESMIAHVEVGRRLPSEKTLRRMLDAVHADDATRRRMIERLDELATSPTPTDLATLTAVVQKLVDAQERRERRDEQQDRRDEHRDRQLAQLADRLEKLERPPAR